MKDGATISLCLIHEFGCHFRRGKLMTMTKITAAQAPPAQQCVAINVVFALSQWRRRSSSSGKTPGSEQFQFRLQPPSGYLVHHQSDGLASAVTHSALGDGCLDRPPLAVKVGSAAL